MTAYVYINWPSSKIQNTTGKVTTIIMAVSSRLCPRWWCDRIRGRRRIRLIQRPHRNLAMKCHVGRQNHIERAARNNRCDRVRHIYPIEHKDRLFRIGIWAWKSGAGGELVTLRFSRARVHSFGAGADLDGCIRGSSTRDSIGEIFVDQIADQGSAGRRRCDRLTALRGILHTLARRSRKRKHHEPEVTEINKIESNTEQQRHSERRFQKALASLVVLSAHPSQKHDRLSLRLYRFDPCKLEFISYRRRS